MQDTQKTNQQHLTECYNKPMKKKDTSLDDIAGSIGALATHVDKQIGSLSDRMSKQIGSLSDRMDNRFEQVDNRFEQIDKRFDRLENRVGNIEQEQRKMREWMERIDSRLAGVESDIKEIYDRIVALEKKFPNVAETEVREMERQLAALIHWAKDVSKQYKIPLPKI